MKLLFVCLLSFCSLLKAEVSSDQINKINTLLKQNEDNIKTIKDILNPSQEEDCEIDFSAVKNPEQINKDKSSSDTAKKSNDQTVEENNEKKSDDDKKESEEAEHEEDED